MRDARHPEWEKLPHPKRMRMEDDMGVIRELAGQEWHTLESYLLDTGYRMEQVINEVIRMPKMRGLAAALLDAPGSTNFGSIELMFTAERQRLLGNCVYQIRDTLDERLQHTRLGGETPARFFKTPYPCIFVELGETRSSPYRLYNALTGDHVLEGAYITETTFIPKFGINCPVSAGELGMREGVPVRVLDIVLVGSPMGKPGGYLDDASTSIELAVTDENEPMEKLVQRYLDYHDRLLPAWRQATPEQRKNLTEIVPHLAKVLLYMNCANARMEAVNERSDLVERLKRIKQGKRAKLERRLAKAYDRIYVGPTHYELPERVASGPRGGLTEPHWREGHFRPQAYGERHSLRKIIWVEKTLVRADLVGTEPPPVKEYVLRD